MESTRQRGYSDKSADEASIPGDVSASSIDESVISVGNMMPVIQILSGVLEDHSDDEETPTQPQQANQDKVCDPCSCCFWSWSSRSYAELASTPEQSQSDNKVIVSLDDTLDPTLKQASGTPLIAPAPVLEPILESRLELAPTRSTMTSSTGDGDDTMDFTRVPTTRLFEDVETATSIGGIEVTTGHSENLLPPEVVLFEPAQTDRQARGRRLIFMNCLLTDLEQKSLAGLHRALEAEESITTKGEGEFPSYVRLHALRIAQQAKHNPEKAVDIISTHLNMRVQMFPLSDVYLQGLLKKGMMYWHGRDRKCRPCLVWNLKLMDGFSIQDGVKSVLFVMEYAIRFALVPGRVENYILLVDLEGLRLKHTTKENRALAKSIATLMEHVYCGRNFCTKIFNLPWVIKAIANSFIPEDKKEKTQFVGDSEIQEVMGKLFEPHQLEQKYGGSAPNLEPEETYPFKFFPQCTGQKQEADWSDKSLHQFTDRQFHEGALWDDSTEEVKNMWHDNARRQSLGRESAADLQSIGVKDVTPCTDMKSWFKLVNPEEAKRRNY